VKQNIGQSLSLTVLSHRLRTIIEVFYLQSSINNWGTEQKYDTVNLVF